MRVIMDGVINMNILYLRALKAINYEIVNGETLEQQLKTAFMDFVCDGCWADLDYNDDLSDITLDDMARALLKVA